MLPTTSPNYDTNVKALGRSTTGLLLIDFTENPDLLDGVVTATSTLDGTTPPSSVISGRIQNHDFSSIGLTTELASPNKGWQSLATADGSGNLTTPQVVTITYPGAITAQNFWWVAQSVYHPVDFSVEYFNAGSWHPLSTRTAYTGSNWGFRNASPITFTAIRITVSKIVPVGGNVRLFAFGPVGRVVLDSKDITDFSILEDTFQEGETPVGQVTSNILDATINNLYKWYTSSNEDSPFYGLLQPNLRVEVYGGLLVDTDTYEYVPYGTFFTTEWSTPSTSYEAKFTAYDCLRKIMENPTPMLPAFVNTSVEFLIDRLFEELGLVAGTDYVIDPSIDVPIKYGWYPDKLVETVLQKLSEAGNVFINVDRQGVIQVQPFIQSNALDLTITDTDMILSADNPQLYRNVCIALEMELYVATLGDVVELARIEEISLNAGASITYENLALNNYPIAEITNIRIQGDGGAYFTVTNVDYGSDAANITLTNTDSVAHEVTMIVKGKPIQTTSTILRVDTGNTWGDKVVKLSNPLIQDETFATSYANSLTNFLKDNHRQYLADWRVNPKLEVNDTIDITDVTDGIIGTDLMVSQLKVLFDGGLEGNLIAHRKMT